MPVGLSISHDQSVRHSVSQCAGGLLLLLLLFGLVMKMMRECLGRSVEPISWMHVLESLSDWRHTDFLLSVRFSASGLSLSATL